MKKLAMRSPERVTQTRVGNPPSAVGVQIRSRTFSEKAVSRRLVLLLEKMVKLCFSLNLSSNDYTRGSKSVQRKRRLQYHSCGKTVFSLKKKRRQIVSQIIVAHCFRERQLLKK